MLTREQIYHLQSLFEDSKLIKPFETVEVDHDLTFIVGGYMFDDFTDAVEGVFLKPSIGNGNGFKVKVSEFLVKYRIISRDIHGSITWGERI